MRLVDNLVIPILCIIGSIHIANAQQDTTPIPCPDISPCTYRTVRCTGTTDLIVDCNAPMEEVKVAFSSITTPITMGSLTLHIQSFGDIIPADILGRNQLTDNLTIVGHLNFVPSLSIDPDAFRTSKLTVQRVQLKKLDMKQVDFQFLAGSTQLFELELVAVINLPQSLPTMPDLPGLLDLRIEESPGLNQEWQNGNVFLPGKGLKKFAADNSGLDDVGVSQFLEWIIPNAAETLTYFLLYNDRVGSIPRQLRSFQNLTNIEIDFNRKDLVVQSNSFNGSINKNIYLVSSRVVNIEPDAFLVSSRVVNIEPDAFLGNYSTNRVSLADNLLTRFEEKVFKSMLQDMTGMYPMDARENPFDCYSDPCHLAWLLRDNRDFLNKFFLGPPQCANGTSFEDLSPSLFQDCP